MNRLSLLCAAALALASSSAFAGHAGERVPFSTGSGQSLAVRADGSVWGFGANTSGELGEPAFGSYESSPGQLTSLSGGTAVASGMYFGMVLTVDGLVHTFGQNTYGQLGDGTTTSRTSPVTVSGVTGATASPLAPTNNQPLPADATEQMKALHPRFASIYASWWGKLR